MNKPTIALLFTSIALGAGGLYVAAQNSDLRDELQDVKKNILDKPSILTDKNTEDNDSELSKEQIAQYLRKTDVIAWEASNYCRNIDLPFYALDSWPETNRKNAYSDTRRVFKNFLKAGLQNDPMSFDDLDKMLKILNENKITLVGKFNTAQAQFFDYGDGRKVLLVNALSTRDRIVLDLVDRLNKLNFSAPGKTISVYREKVEGYDYVYFAQGRIGDKNTKNIFGDAPRVQVSILDKPCYY